MRRPAEIRTAPRGWVRVLKAIYPFLRERGVGDLTLYGSQALSVYMRTPLRSKDMDLLSSQFGPRLLDLLYDELGKLRGVVRTSTNVQTKELDKGKLTTYSVELRVDGRPFFVEVFDKVLDGRPLSLIGRYVQDVEKWGIRLWTPEPNALVCLRLAFRPPEGISPLNARRLNRFITENRRALSTVKIRQIMAEWQIEGWVERNLVELYRRHRMRILWTEKMIPGLRL